MRKKKRRSSQYGWVFLLRTCPVTEMYLNFHRPARTDREAKDLNKLIY